MAARKKTGTRRNGSAAFVPPDVLGDEARSETLKAILRDLQDQRFRLEVSMTINDHDEADIVPGSQTDVDRAELQKGEIDSDEFEARGKSYRKRFDEIAAAERRLVDAYSHLFTPAEAD